MNAPDRLKLSIQMKIMMSNDCEVHSMLKGLNFTDLYKVRFFTYITYDFFSKQVHLLFL